MAAGASGGGSPARPHHNPTTSPMSTSWLASRKRCIPGERNRESFCDMEHNLLERNSMGADH
jgi:hypothetical protein